MFDAKVIEMLLIGIKDTLYMTLGSTLGGYLLGLPLGVVLTVTRAEGLHPCKPIYRVIDFFCNIIRSVPFLILLILLIPFTRLIVGRSYGSTATIVPLVICAAPYIARVVESSLNEVDAGVIEAAKAMGANNWQIITRVLLVEAKTSLLTGVTITTGILLGYSAMSGTVGGGGLKDIGVVGLSGIAVDELLGIDTVDLLIGVKDGHDVQLLVDLRGQLLQNMQHGQIALLHVDNAQAVSTSLIPAERPLGGLPGGKHGVHMAYQQGVIVVGLPVFAHGAFAGLFSHVHLLTEPALGG